MTTNYAMAMSEKTYSQWPCPHCFRPFPTSAGLRNHLDERSAGILVGIQKLLQRSCSLLLGDVFERGGVDKSPSQSPESSTKLPTADPLGLTCPHKECDDEKKTVYTKKANLLRHYQSHIACSAECPFCSKSFDCLRALVKHCEKCKSKEKGIEDREAAQAKRILCLSTSDALDQQLDERVASLRIRRREEGNGEIYGQPSRPPKRRRTDANSGGSPLGTSTSLLQSMPESETDRCEQVQPGYEHHPANNIGTSQSSSEGKSTTELMQQVRWGELGFSEDFNPDQSNVSRATPISLNRWSGAVFAANIPVQPDLWLESVFTDGSGGAQMEPDYFLPFPVQQHGNHSLGIVPLAKQ